MLIENYLDSRVGWIQGQHIYTYCSGEYTWNGIRPSGEQPTTFYLNSPLTGTSYSIDIEITNNDTQNRLENIPELYVLINGTNYSLSTIYPDAYSYYQIDPEDSVILTVTLNTMQFGGNIDLFGIDTVELYGTSDCSVRVVSSDIFTGWMQRGDYADVKVYDNGIWTS